MRFQKLGGMWVGYVGGAYKWTHAILLANYNFHLQLDKHFPSSQTAPDHH